MPQLQHVNFLLGSAPVGPTTVQRLLRYTGRSLVVHVGCACSSNVSACSSNVIGDSLRPLFLQYHYHIHTMFPQGIFLWCGSEVPRRVCRRVKSMHTDIISICILCSSIRLVVRMGACFVASVTLFLLTSQVMGTPLTLTQEQRLEIFKSVCIGCLYLCLFCLRLF